MLQDFIPKLKSHLLPRVQAILKQEALLEDIGSTPPHGSLSPSEDHDRTESEEANSIYLKNDRIYEHNIVKINYTTYDTRRSQDILNPKTRCRDVMVLARPQPQDEAGSESQRPHRFWYARILGIFHANVVYTGVGMRDYVPRRLEFLWVRWFQRVELPELRGLARAGYCLDAVKFLPMAGGDAFGFIDPIDVLRGSHLPPAFRQGRVHPDAKGFSKCAGDARDWKIYYVNRCVQRSDLRYAQAAKLTNDYRKCSFLDCDMLMRYHWGLAVGHQYTCNLNSTAESTSTGRNHSGANLQHAHVDNDSDNEVSMDERWRVIPVASGSKGTHTRTPGMPRDGGHSQVSVLEQVDSDESLEGADDLPEMSLEDCEDWCDVESDMDSDDCHDNLRLDANSDYDSDSDSDQMDIDM